MQLNSDHPVLTDISEHLCESQSLPSVYLLIATPFVHVQAARETFTETKTEQAKMQATAAFQVFLQS